MYVKRPKPKGGRSTRKAAQAKERKKELKITLVTDKIQHAYTPPHTCTYIHRRGRRLMDNIGLTGCTEEGRKEANRLPFDRTYRSPFSFFCQVVVISTWKEGREEECHHFLFFRRQGSIASQSSYYFKLDFAFGKNPALPPPNHRV